MNTLVEKTSCTVLPVSKNKWWKRHKINKKLIPRAGFEPATVRCQESITAENHDQLDHQGLSFQDENI